MWFWSWMDDPILEWWFWPWGHGMSPCCGGQAQMRAGGGAVQEWRSVKLTWARLWYSTLSDSLDSVLLLSSPQWEAASWNGLAYSSLAQPPCVGDFLSDQEGSPPPGLEKVSQCCLTLRAKQQCRVSSLLGGSVRNPEGAPTEGTIILLGDFKALVGSNSINWRGVTGRNWMNVCIAHSLWAYPRWEALCAQMITLM